MKNTISDNMIVVVILSLCWGYATYALTAYLEKRRPQRSAYLLLVFTLSLLVAYVAYLLLSVSTSLIAYSAIAGLFVAYRKN